MLLFIAYSVCKYERITSLKTKNFALKCAICKTIKRLIVFVSVKIN